MQDDLGKQRLFFGLRPPAECALYWLKTAHGELGDPLGLRWQSQGDVHLTVYFLGEIGAGCLSRLTSRMATAVAGSGPVEVETGPGLWFPEAPRPVVLVASVHLGSALAALARTVAQVVKDIGLPVDPRPFQPHITLARLRGQRSTRPLPPRFTPKVFTVSELVLYESRSAASGMRYFPRHVFSLI